MNEAKIPTTWILANLTILKNNLKMMPWYWEIKGEQTFTFLLKNKKYGTRAARFAWLLWSQNMWLITREGFLVAIEKYN